jgi:hypothetical protein
VAVTYAFGGFYMDDDADIRTSLELAVRPDDAMIATHEMDFFSHRCYQSDLKLSHKQLRKRFGGDFRGVDRKLYRLTQWMFFAKRKHTFLKRVLDNIVEGIRMEYFGQHPYYVHPRDRQFRFVVCATGNTLFC